MIACIDTHYFDSGSRTAMLQFREWDATSAEVTTIRERVEVSAPYAPGEFYLRELPCIADAIECSRSQLDMVVIDGYVDFGERRPGLGWKLFELLHSRVSVIGVAKNPFRSAETAVKLYRRGSTRPLYITAVGVPVDVAKNYIDRMHGEYRLPTLLKLADSMARGISSA